VTDLAGGSAQHAKEIWARNLTGTAAVRKGRNQRVETAESGSLRESSPRGDAMEGHVQCCTLSARGRPSHSWGGPLKRAAGAQAAVSRATDDYWQREDLGGEVRVAGRRYFDLRRIGRCCSWETDR
jgi:hypothetical protein